MFDLDQAVAEWRTRMLGEGIRSPEVLDELECHLREEIANQMQSGMIAQQAFETAALLIGKPFSLRTEFARANGRLELRKRKFIFVCGIIPALLMVLAVLLTLPTQSMNWIEWFSALAGLAAMTSYVGSLAFLHVLLGEIQSKRARLAGQITVTVAWLAAGTAMLASGMPHLSHADYFVPLVFWAILSMVPVLVWICHAAAGQGGFLPPNAGPSQSLGPLPIPPILPFSPRKPFAPYALQALELARAEAQQLHHDFIGTEHLLLGLLSQKPNGVSDLLQRLGLDDGIVRGEIIRLVVCGAPALAALRPPYTPRARRALDLAAREARALNQARIEAEHVLLGLLREGSGVAAKALENLGVRVEKLRTEVLRTTSCAPPA